MSEQTLPQDKQARKNIPLARGLLDYFPNALASVAEVSRVANEQHNPGEEMHWAWGKSNDHADCILRHVVDRGTIDDDNLLHSAKVAWRALALLEEELVAAGAKPGRAVWFPEAEKAAEPTMRCSHCESTHAAGLSDDVAIEYLKNNKPLGLFCDSGNRCNGRLCLV